MDARKGIVEQLSKIVQELFDQKIEVKLEVPEDSTHGDYSSNIALMLSKKLGKNPREIAGQIKEKVHGSQLMVHGFDKVEVAGAGFINFYLSTEFLTSNLPSILSQKEKFGTSDENHGKQVIVEFSSPNIAKPFTVGHLRSTIIGNAIANLLNATGWTVYKDNHLGDWGTQFGKQIYAIKAWGNEEKIEKVENPVKELVALYVKFHEEAEKNPALEDEARAWFKKLEDRDPEARRLWQKCIDWSFKEFDKLYGMIDVSFTENSGRGYGESFFEDKMQPVLDDLLKKKLLIDSQGAKVVYFPGDMYPPLMIIKQDGATLYATRDLATDKFRIETYGSDVKIINEVGAEQALYFNQLYALEKMLGWVKDGQRVHVKHGLYRFKDQKMSTRRGNTIWLEDVLHEATQKAQKLGKEDGKESLAQEIGVGALKWNDLKRNPIQDIVFDWDDILNMQGNSGPYMQYSYARTQSILEKVKSQPRFIELINSEGKIKSQNVKLEKEEIALLRILVHYPEIVQASSDMLSTSLLCNYLYELSKAFNLFYEKHRVIGDDKDVQEFRVALVAGVGQVLKNGLNLLGISAPEKI